MQSNGQETLRWFAIYIYNFINGMNSSITLVNNYSLFHGTWFKRRPSVIECDYISRAWLVRINGLMRDCGGSCSNNSIALSHRYAFRLLSSYASLFDEYTYADMLAHICGRRACTYQYIPMAVHVHVCVQACIYVHIIYMHVYAWLFCAYGCWYRF